MFREVVNFVNKEVKTAVVEKTGRMFSFFFKTGESDLFLKGKGTASFLLDACLAKAGVYL